MSAGGRRTFADAFAEGLELREMSLGALREALAARGTPISLATLSYWRAGLRQPEQEPSMRAVVAIEEILGLFPGELESLTSPGRRRLPRSDPLAVNPDRQEAVARLLGELGMSTPYDELIERDVTMKYDLDQRGRAFQMTKIAVVEAVVNGASRRPAVLSGETPDEPPLKFTSLGGQRIGRVISDQESMVTVAEMLLDEELAAGETAILEEQVELAAAEHDNELQYFAWPRVRSVTLWVRFHPDKVPPRCEAYTVVDGLEKAEEITTYGHSVNRTIAGFGPGTFGLRWFWDDDV
jgi:hypothetical protein